MTSRFSPSVQEHVPLRALASLFGREEDLARVGELLLREQARLVTLCGPPGVGKTRLAQELLAGTGAPFEGGTFCAVGDAVTAADFVRLLSRALGVALPTAHASPVARLGTALRARGRSVLVLDDVDAVLDVARPVVTELLLLAPLLVVVATSRSRFHLAVEWIHELAPLDVESASGLPGAAVDLFRQRVREVGGTLDGADPATIIALVRRLEGLPLAIELAAARSTLMTASELLAKLDEPMLLLTGAGRSLRASIAASWRLLSGDEQRALGVACAFPAPFGVALGEAACQRLGMPDALGLLQSLRERSLMQLAPGGDGQYRLRVYDSVRAFVAEAGEAGDRQAIEQVIAGAAGAIAQRFVTSPWGPKGMERERELLAEEPNLASVLDRAAASDIATDDVLHVAAALVHLREEHGPADALLPVLERVHGAAARAGSNITPEARPSFEAALAGLLERAGRFTEADALYESAVRGARSSSAPHLEGLVHLRRAHGGRVLGRQGVARAAVDDALRLAARTADPIIGTIAERLAADAYQAALDVEGGLAAIGRSVAHARHAGDRRLTARALLTQAVLRADADDPETALGGALAVRTQMSDEPRTFGFACLVAGAAALALGRRREADDLLAEAVTSNNGAGLPRLVAYALAFAGVSAFEQRELKRSDDAFATAAELLGPAAEPMRVAAVRAARGVLAAIGGRVEKGRRILAAVREQVSPSDRIVVDLLAIGLDAVAPTGDPCHEDVRRRLATARESMTTAHGYIPSVVLRLMLRFVEGIAESYAPSAGAVVLDPVAQQLRLPSGILVALDKKPMLWRLLRALAEAHLRAPGERVGNDALVRAVWPDEKMSPPAAQNRLAVALHKLKKLAHEIVETSASGACLQPAARVVWCARAIDSERRSERE